MRISDWSSDVCSSDLDGQLRDGAVDWADETLEAAALDRLGQLLLAQPRLALGLGEIGEDARARLGGGLPRIATSHRDLRLRLAGGGEGDRKSTRLNSSH